MTRKCINLTATETAEWTAAQDISDGPDGVRARIIRRAKPIALEQGHVRVYAGSTCVLAVSYTEENGYGVAAGEQVR